MPPFDPPLPLPPEDDLRPVAGPAAVAPSLPLPPETDLVPVSQAGGGLPMPPETDLVPVSQPPREEGFFSGFGSGTAGAAREAVQLGTGHAFDPSLAAQPEPERGWFNQLGYGIGHMLPQFGGALAGGELGGMAGGAIGGPPGALVGGVGGAGVGMGVTAFAQGLVPNFRAAIQEGLSPEDAVSRAYKMAAAEGIVGAVTVPLMEAAPIKSAVSKFLFNTVVGMPAVGGLQRGVIDPAITGHPTPSLGEMGEGAAQDIAAGAILGGVHHVIAGKPAERPPGEPRVTFEEEPPPQPGAPLPLPPETDLVPVQTQTPIEAPPAPPAPPEPPPVSPPPVEPAPAPTPTEGAPISVPEPVTAARPPEPVPTPVLPAVEPERPAGGAAAPEPAPSPAEARPNGAVPEPAPGSVAPGLADVTPPTTPPTTPPADRLATPTTTEANRKLDTRFEVVEAKDLTPASGDLQPRDRQNRVQSQRQQDDIYSNFDPERLHASPEADRGSPIVSQEDNTLLTGNNRVEVLKRIHAGEEPADMARSQVYREMIQRVTGQDVSQMDAPVLVRRIQGAMTPEERVAVAREGNVSATQRMSAPEQAKVDAANLKDEMLARLNPEQDLTAASNRAFVGSWLKTVPETEHNTVLDAQGNLSPDGVKRLRAAVLAKAYGEHGIIERGLDTTHDEVRGISSGLNDAAPAVSRLQSDIAAGKLGKQYDLSKNIGEAVDRVRVARERGQGLNDILGQGDMFGGQKLDPVTERLVRSFYNPEGTRAASRTAIARALKEYARLAREQGHDLLGTQSRPPREILDQLLEARSRKGDQGELTPAPAPTDATPPAKDHLADRINRIADEWERLGDPSMAQAVRNGLTIRPPTEESATFLQRKLDEHKAATAPDAPKPKETFDLDTFMQNDSANEGKFWDKWKAEALDAGDLTARVQAKAQELLDQMNAAGATKDTAHYRGGPEAAEAKKQLSELLGQFTLYAKRETAVRKDYARGDADKLDAARQELDRYLGDTTAPAVSQSKPTAKMTRAELTDELREHGGYSTMLKPDVPVAALRAEVEKNRAAGAGHAEADMPPPGQGLKPGQQAEAPDTAKAIIKATPKRTRAPKALSPDKIDQADKLRAAIAKREKAPKTKDNLDYLAKAREQLAKLDARDEVLASRGEGGTGGKTTDQLAAEQGWPAPATKTPTSVGDGTKGFMDYQLANGTPTYQQIFKDAGHNPASVINRPIREQVEIGAKQLAKKFGFRDVNVKGDLKNVRDQIMEMYRAMADVGNAMQIPHDGMSLGGHIALELNGNLRKGSPLGVYKPGTITIGISGRSNSFMHEWTHAVDHYLSDRLISHPKSGKLLSQNARNNDLVPGRHTVEEHFAKLLNEMSYDKADWLNKRMALETEAAKTNAQGDPTAAARKAQEQLQRLDAGGTKLRIRPSDYARTSADFEPGKAKYWASAHELLARAHEAYIASRARLAGVSPRGVAMEDIAHEVMTDRLLAMTYPKEGDRLRIFRALDDLHAAMRREQAFGTGKVMGRSTDVGLVDPLLYPKMNPRDEPGVFQWMKKAKVDFNTLKSGEAFQRFKDPLLYDKSRPTDKILTGSERFKDFFRALTSSHLHILKTIIDRSPEGAKAPLQTLYDRLGADPGSGRYTGTDSWEEKVQRTARPWQKSYARILEEYGLKRMTAEQKAMFHHTMVTGDSTYPRDPDPRSTDRVPIPPTIMKAAEATRLQVMDQAHSYFANSTPDTKLGYVGGYWKRMIDAAKLSADTPGFIRDATAQYKKVVDDAVSGATDKAAELRKHWLDMGKELRDNAPWDLKTGMEEMAKLRRQMTLLDRKITKTPDEIARHAEAQDRIDELIDEHQGALSSWIGDIKAENWATRAKGGGPVDFDTKGPSGSFTRGRELPPEADVMMRNWYHTDPHVAVPLYLESVARRANYLRLFEDKRIGTVEELLDQATRAGAHGEDIHRARAMINASTGQTSYSNAPGLARASNLIAAWASVALLPRAAWQQVSEPMGAAMATGDMRYAVDNYAKLLRNLWDTSGRRDRTAIVEHLGIINSGAHDSILNHRMADYSSTPQLAGFMQWFYRMTGMHYVTNAQQVAASEAGTAFIRRTVNRATATGTEKSVARARDNAERLLKEWGVNVDGGQHARLAEWLNTFDNMPTAKQIDTSPEGIGDIYGRALFRLVRRTIQDPSRAERPAYSADPLGKLTMSFLSFNWSFQRNVLDAAMGRIEHAYARGKGADTGVKGVAKGLMEATPETMGTLYKAATLVAAATLTKTLHHLLFNRDQWDKHEKEGDLVAWLIESGASSSGVGGTLDPLAQVAQHIRYDSSISNLVNGAPLAYGMENLQAIINPYLVGEDDPTSNVATWKQTRAVYQMLLEPAAMYGLTKVSQMFPGGIIAPIAGAAAWELSSPDLKNAFSDALSGPKGASLPKPGSEDKVPELPDVDEKPDKDPKLETSASPMATIAAGIADDAAVPMLRAFPWWAKGIGAAGLLGYGAYNWWDRAATFRDLPAPEPK